MHLRYAWNFCTPKSILPFYLPRRYDRTSLTTYASSGYKTCESSLEISCLGRVAYAFAPYRYIYMICCTFISRFRLHFTSLIPVTIRFARSIHRCVHVQRRTVCPVLTSSSRPYLRSAQISLLYALLDISPRLLCMNVYATFRSNPSLHF